MEATNVPDAFITYSNYSKWRRSALSIILMTSSMYPSSERVSESDQYHSQFPMTSVAWSRRVLIITTIARYASCIISWESRASVTTKSLLDPGHIVKVHIIDDQVISYCLVASYSNGTIPSGFYLITSQVKYLSMKTVNYSKLWVVSWTVSLSFPIISNRCSLLELPCLYQKGCG